MMGSEPVVFVVDDDVGVREATCDLLASAGYRVATFATAGDFVAHPRPDAPACLVLDVHLPGLGGLDLQSALVKADAEIPIVFITGHGDIPMSVRAMKAGAVEFLTKPFGDRQFLDAVQLAIERDTVERKRRREMEEARGRYELLTSRERQVMALVVEGLLNKQIAGRLGLSEITVKVYRARVTRKMRAGSLVELVKIAQRLGMAVSRH